LQADPYIQAPKNSQNYDRYSYVLNNPLSYTDPSGYSFRKFYELWSKLDGRYYSHKHIFSKNQSLANWVQVGLNFIPYFGRLASAHFAFDRVYFANGTVGAAFTAGVTTYLGYSGQSNRTGSESAGYYKGGAFTAVATVGGTNSDQTGGKFTNGAARAGFAYAVAASPTGTLNESAVASGAVARVGRAKVRGSLLVNDESRVNWYGVAEDDWESLYSDQLAILVKSRVPLIFPDFQFATEYGHLEQLYQVTKMPTQWWLDSNGGFHRAQIGPTEPIDEYFWKAPDELNVTSYSRTRIRACAFGSCEIIK